jgi:hypothetical protein
MTKHLLNWLCQFLKLYKRMQKFDSAWCSLAPYPDFQPFRLSYTQTTSWMGKEMRQAGRILCAILAVALDSPAPEEKAPFKRAQRCVRAYIQFQLMAKYESHDDKTLVMMNDYLVEFYVTVDIFKQFRTRKAAENQAATEALRRVGEAELEASSISNLVQRESFLKAQKESIHQWQLGYIDELIGFNFPKMHLMQHYVEHVKQFGSIISFSTDASEAAHIDHLKKGWARSNHRNAYKQILRYRDRVHQFKMRELNLIQLAREGIYDNSIVEVYQGVLSETGM